ncbi:hypothetical protein [Jatrophihabitans endophyticus]|uniref:hypothetical protein n=1 Tax=Jatrophihabitans endophyticus TaxID=1206085 RepID=UPI0019F13FDA|nr:hypothetical protein [Jatrophihabitans endophyticus]MBE7188990.1 hypothetical protein [Jatrophihabitans endophyticus]
MPDFEVFDKSVLHHGHGPAVTILKGRVLSLNRDAYVALEQPGAVELLFDRKKRIIGLRAVDPSVPHACFVRSSGRSSNAPHLVSAMAFLAHYEIDTSESRRWRCWVEDDVLCLNLEDESEVVVSICSSRRAS